MNERLDQINTRLQELQKDVEARRSAPDITSEEVADRTAEIEKLVAEKEEVVKELNQRAIDAFKPETKGVFMETNTRNEALERANKFIADKRMVIKFTEEEGGFRGYATRSALLSSGAIAKPNAVNGIHDNLYDNLGLLNDFTVQSYAEHEEVVHSFKYSHLTASEHTEGSSPTESEVVFKLVKIKPVKCSVIAYVSRAIKRLTPLDYLASCAEEINYSLVEWSENYSIEQIQSSATTDEIALCDSVTLSTTGIDEHTLRQIVYSYRPGKKYKTNPVLLMTQAQLIEFGDVRGTNEKMPVYDITPNQSNTRGTIRDGGLTVNYILVEGLSNMLYGYMPAFEFATFGDFEIEADESYKFAEGLITLRGEAWIGGALTVNGAFEKISFSA